MFKNFAFFFFFATLLLPNIILSFTEPLTLLGSITNIILPGGIIYFLMSISTKLGRTIWLFFPLIFFAAFQIVLLDLYGKSIIAVDMFLNLVTTNTSEVTELLGNMLPIIGLVAILYIPSLICGIHFIRHKVTLSRIFLRYNRKVAITMTSCGFILLLVCICSEKTYSIKRDLYPVNVCYNVYLAIDRTKRTADYHQSSSGFTYNAISSRQPETREIYILVIGETARAENWQLHGYERMTTPKLSSRNDLFICDNAYSESNTTHKRVPMLLSPVDATDFDKNIYKVKSLVTAFKEAGFHTTFLSNQRYNNSFIDFFAFESDTTIFIKEIPEKNKSLDINSKPDSELLPLLDLILLKQTPKHLIVLHTYGSHFNYRDRYNKEEEVFRPCDYPNANKNNRDKLINAYDNTIVATDRLISQCIERLDSINGISGLIYTSDHGEDIYDDGSNRFLHASPRPTIHQVHVPFFAWLSDSFKEMYPAITSALENNMHLTISTSRSFCPTSLDMAGIKISGNVVDTTASLFSNSYIPREPIYLDDHNKAVPLKEII